jgi:hypothetical protein
MSDNCIEFRKTSRCNKVRRLKLQCPDLKSRHEYDNKSNKTDNTTNEHETELNTSTDASARNNQEIQEHQNSYETLFEMISSDNFD